MKKRMLLLTLVLVCAMVLCACGCKHETWNDADCVNPKTCAECGETEGEALGHSWVDADCVTPKTCSVCGETEGEALGHSWVDADCVTPKTCSACGETEGEALGHIWLEATTEAPETCETCGETQGERIITDERFTTEACSGLFGTWEGTVTMTGKDLGEPMDQYVDELTMNVTIVLENDGSMSMSIMPVDEEQLVQILVDMTMDVVYAELASTGMSEEQIDELIEMTYGMTMEEYVRAEVAKMDMADLFSRTGVYYVDGGKIYLGDSWDAVMTPDEFELDGDTLYLPMNEEELTPFTRVVDGE